MKREHKVLFENLLQEEYNRGYNDCKKAVAQSMRIQPQEPKTHSTHTPRGWTRKSLMTIMQENPASKHVEEWRKVFNGAHDSNLSQGAISGALSRMKRDGLVIMDENGWRVCEVGSQQQAFKLQKTMVVNKI